MLDPKAGEDMRIIIIIVWAFSPNRPCQHNTRLVYLDDHGFDAEGTIMEEIPAGGWFQLFKLTWGRAVAGSPFCHTHSAYGWSLGVSFWSLAPRGRGGHWDSTALLWVPWGSWQWFLFDLHELILLFIWAPRGLGRDGDVRSRAGCGERLWPDQRDSVHCRLSCLPSAIRGPLQPAGSNWRSRYRPPHAVDDQVHWQSRHPEVPVPSELVLPQCVWLRWGSHLAGDCLGFSGVQGA